MIARQTSLSHVAVAAAVVSAALGARAAALEGAADIQHRWLPSLALGFDVQVESTPSATASSSLRDTVTDDREFLTAVPVLEGELTTPELGFLPGRPRAFAVADWHYGWLVVDEDRPVVVEGTIGEPVLIPPRCQPGNPTRCLEEDLDLVEGMGSRVDASIENGWSAGIGVAFTVPVGDLFTISVKPAFLYHREEVELRGEVKDPFLIIGSSPPNDNTVGFVQIAGKKTEEFGALGGRLALEYEVGRRGPVDLVLYLQGQLFWWLDPETSFDAASGSDTAHFEYERDGFIGAGGMGIRVRWRGL